MSYQRTGDSSSPEFNLRDHFVANLTHWSFVDDGDRILMVPPTSWPSGFHIQFNSTGVFIDEGTTSSWTVVKEFDSVFSGHSANFQALIENDDCLFYFGYSGNASAFFGAFRYTPVANDPQPSQPYIFVAGGSEFEAVTDYGVIYVGLDGTNFVPGSLLRVTSQSSHNTTNIKSVDGGNLLFPLMVNGEGVYRGNVVGAYQLTDSYEDPSNLRTFMLNSQEYKTFPINPDSGSGYGFVHLAIAI